MKKLLIVPFLGLTLFVSAQKNKSYSVGFYNVENLFDTVNDTTINDEEFLPEGKNNWTTERYSAKIKNLNQVIDTMGSVLALGLGEIENEAVIRDLLAASRYKNSHGVVHFDSPDDRGIDVGLIYDSLKLQLLEAGKLRFALPGEYKNTRDILWAKFKYKKDVVYMLVNHWPSRRGGQEVSEVNRLTAANTAKEFIDKVLVENSKAKIIFMGDLNDYPADKAPKMIAEVLVPQIVKSSGEFGGSYKYKGEWDVLDHIMISTGLVTAKKGILFIPNSGKILSPSFILTEVKGQQYPYRTYGKSYEGGYSDHLPVTIQVRLK